MLSIKRLYQGFRNWIAAGAYACATWLPLRHNVVLLQSHTGDSLFGNPFYLARHLARHYPDLEVRCVSSDPGSDSAKLRACTDVRWVQKGTLAYIISLATAGRLVNDTSFPPYFARRHGQRYLQTWHGTPLKALGRSVPFSLHSNLRNMQRNFLQATEVLFPNQHCEAMLKRDFDLASLWGGRAIRRGYPRNDILVHSTVESAGRPKGPINVAYMPTWRGTHQSLAYHGPAQAESTKRLLSELDEKCEDQFHIWVKLHPLVRRSLALDGLSNVHMFPDDVETYEHLARCDMLVTDYSSVMIDFAVSRRPVVLYAPDLETYGAGHGFTIPLSSLPFPRVATVDQLVDAIRKVGHFETNQALEQMLANETGNSTALVIKDFLRLAGSPQHPPSRPATSCLVLVDRPLDSSTAKHLQELVYSLGLDLGIVVAIPGDVPESELLTDFARANPHVAICPTTSAAGAGGWWLPKLVSRSERWRLFGPAAFHKVLVLGSRKSYRRLIHELRRDCPVEFVPHTTGTAP